jgi:hypothetical protein
MTRESAAQALRPPRPRPRLPLLFARLECRRVSYARGTSPFFSASADALALLVASENDIGGNVDN